jgi:hypothetical protein
MGLHEERIQILQMIQDGQVTAEEGAKLLSALKASSQEDAATQSAQPRWFRVRVTDQGTGRDKVRVNLPLALVDVGIKMGARFLPEDEDIDFGEIAAAIRSGAQGKIIDVLDEEDNERVEIFIE